MFNTDLVEDQAEGIERSEFISGDARLRTIATGFSVDDPAKGRRGTVNKKPANDPVDWFTAAGSKFRRPKRVYH